jgi:hypothetical protein
MPILTSNYIASWYLVNLFGKNRLLQSWTESLQQEVSNKPMIQGDIGTHIMDIGGVWYSATVESPVIIMGQPNTSLYDAFDIVLEGLAVAQNPIDSAIAESLDYVLDTSTITINPEGVNVTANIENAAGWVNQKQYFGDVYTDFIGRTARFYDTIFSFMGGIYLIKSAEFNIKVELDKMYFVGQSQIPTYAIKGYTVEGRAVLLTTPDSYDAQVLINLQTPGVSNPINKTIALQIQDQYAANGLGYRRLNLGEYMEIPTISLNMNPGQTIEATVNFKTYFRRSSVLA